MTIEQVKEEAKKHFNKEISDEQAQAWLYSQRSGEIADDELDNVAGGGCSSNSEESGYVCPSCGSTNIWNHISMAQDDQFGGWLECNDCGCKF